MGVIQSVAVFFRDLRADRTAQNLAQQNFFPLTGRRNRRRECLFFGEVRLPIFVYGVLQKVERRQTDIFILGGQHAPQTFLHARAVAVPEKRNDPFPQVGGLVSGKGFDDGVFLPRKGRFFQHLHRLFAGEGFAVGCRLKQRVPLRPCGKPGGDFFQRVRTAA